MCTNVFTHKHSELSACSFSIIPVQCVLKHVPTRLTILTGSKTQSEDKNNQNFVVASWQSSFALGLQIYFLSFLKMLTALSTGRGCGGGGGGEN